MTDPLKVQDDGQILGRTEIVNASATVINPATEDTVSQLVTAITNALDFTAYDLNAAAFSEVTAITNDFELDSVELNFSTAEAKTITITSADGTILWGGDVDQTAANQGYLTTAQNFYLGFNHRGFDGGDNITVSVTQFASPGTMDCVLRTKSGTNSLLGNPHVGWVDTDGTERGYQNSNGKPLIATSLYASEVAKGNIPGAVAILAEGENDDIAIATNGEDMWLGPTAQIPHPPVAGVRMQLVSTSAEDGVAGTGVLSVRIEYIDAAGAQQVEDLTMDGLTPALTDAVNISFVNHMFATSVGTNGVAVGDIDIQNIGGTVTYNRVALGGNKSLSSVMRVPNNGFYYLTEWHCSISGGKPTAVRIRSTDWSGILYNGDDPVFLFKDTAFLGESTFDRDFKPPIKIPGGSTIKVSCWATQNATFGSAGFNGYFEADS